MGRRAMRNRACGRRMRRAARSAGSGRSGSREPKRSHSRGQRGSRQCRAAATAFCRGMERAPAPSMQSGGLQAARLLSRPHLMSGCTITHTPFPFPPLRPRGQLPDRFQGMGGRGGGVILGRWGEERVATHREHLRRYSRPREQVGGIQAEANVQSRHERSDDCRGRCGPPVGPCGLVLATH